MKRVLFSVFMLAVIALTCAWTVQQITATKNKLTADIAAITAAVEAEDYDETMMRTRELSEYWNMEERRLMHFVRHSHIDSITLSIARIGMLAKHEETAELLAELSSIAWQITHVWESEKPSLKNAF